MRNLVVLFLNFFFLVLPSVVPAQESYPAHPDSKVKENVPRGKVESFAFADSKIYPGTTRNYFVYVPDQYRLDQPAALMVFQDGEKYVRKYSQWKVPTVFDNLIAAGEMPVTIAVCVNPGVVKSNEEKAMDRFNRSLEYDDVSDRYARFLVDELLPVVKAKYSITDDPNLRGIGGSSSGAIAAFGVAWHRPDQFRRVFSTVGTYVGLRGGNEYPTMIRKFEPKPLRVFLQDGKNDLDIYGGSWWNANLTMLSALKWAGYQVNHEWGDGGHNEKHGSAILPDAMKWLWKDFDQPITSDASNHPEFKDRLVAGQGWTKVGESSASLSRIATTKDGTVMVSSNSGVLKLDAATGKLVSSTNAFPASTTLDFDVRKLASKISDDTASPISPVAMTMTPDKRFLLVADGDGRFVWSYLVGDDSKLLHGQPYGYVHSPSNEMSTGITDITMTEDGSPIVATTLGLQVFDQPGRVHVILPLPAGVSSTIQGVTFGGEDLTTLYVITQDAIYSRPTKMKGVQAWSDSVKPPKPRL